MADVFGPPHDMFCDCCAWWKKQIEQEARGAKERQGEQEEPADYHTQADGFHE